MAAPLERGSLQQLAEAKLLDAMLLFEHERWANAYYLAGYSVELGLKAAIARNFRAEVIPDKNFVTNIYKHDLKELLSLSGLRLALTAAAEASPDLEANWGICAAWNEQSRYESKPQADARFLIEAVSDQASGVMAWLRQHW